MVCLKKFSLLSPIEEKKTSTGSAMKPPPWLLPSKSSCLGLAAISYIAIDYLRHVAPSWNAILQPILWVGLALAAIVRTPYYEHWSSEFRSALPFIASMVFMLATLFFESLCVRFVTAVLGLDWHKDTNPLPDTGQWLLLALNEKLPALVVNILRARIIGLHHYLMLFMMLAFSVLFNSVKAPGLGLGARYMFTMALGRILRTITFVSTIVPSVRPWCARTRFGVPSHPHPWAQKYYMPYASDVVAIRNVLSSDRAYADVTDYPGEHRPDWGLMSFLVDFVRPARAETTWYSVLKKAEGGCNDLVFSGHMFVAVLTAMAWTEAYGGWTSAFIWLLVVHSAQREIRERHHYSVDCVVAIYVGILLWRMTGFLWSAKDVYLQRSLIKLQKIQTRLFQAAKDSDMAKVRELLDEVELGGQSGQKSSESAMWLFGCVTIILSLIIVVLALTLTSGG